MGTFNRFRTLKAVPGVEKLVKFNQATLLQAARDKGKITQENFEVVKGGACIAYTFAWISQQLNAQPGTKPRFHRVATVRPKGKDDEKHIETAQSLVKYFAGYSKLGKQQQNFQAAADSLGENFGVEIHSDSDNDKESGSLINVFTYFARNESAMPVGEAASITIAFSDDPNTAHSVGLFRGKDKHVYFFDPNVGEYKMKTVAIDQFFNEYISVITNNAQIKWNLDDLCWGMRVQRLT